MVPSDSVPSSSQRVQPQECWPRIHRGAQTLSISCAMAAETVAFQFAKRVLESDLAWLPLADGLLLLTWLVERGRFP